MLNLVCGSFAMMSNCQSIQEISSPSFVNIQCSKIAIMMSQSAALTGRMILIVKGTIDRFSSIWLT